jgi:hypothetical protein
MTGKPEIIPFVPAKSHFRQVQTFEVADNPVLRALLPLTGLIQHGPR